jgi:hypothetical protein
MQMNFEVQAAHPHVVYTPILPMISCIPWRAASAADAQYLQFFARHRVNH